MSSYFPLDFETGEVFRKIPVSCLTTDIVRSSMITKLAVDTETKVMHYLFDIQLFY